MSFIQPLFEGPIDIFGDIHGEIGALTDLLCRLGYDGDGNNPLGYRPVFLGDLIDRGPDSIAVVRLVRRWVENGKAQCIMGNHELNILRTNLSAPKMKHGNHWFFGQPERLIKGSQKIHFQRLADKGIQQEFISFFKSLPLALERSDLQAVHACWHQPSVDILKAYTDSTMTAFQCFATSIERQNQSDDNQIRCDLRKQNDNPIKVLTSGLEEPAEKTYFAGGMQRQLTRSPWWRNYSGKPTIIGHYWRRIKPISQPPDKKHAPDIFKGCSPFEWLDNKVMCIDYSVGGRFTERHAGLPVGSLSLHLCALRINESACLLYFDDGRCVEIEKPD